MKTYILIIIFICPVVVWSQSVGVLGKLGVGLENPAVELDIKSDTSVVNLNLATNGPTSLFGSTISRINLYRTTLSQKGFVLRYYNDPGPLLPIDEFIISASNSSGNLNKLLAIGSTYIDLGNTSGLGFYINLYGNLRFNADDRIIFYDDSQQSSAAGTKVENGIIQPASSSIESFQFPQGSSSSPPAAMESTIYYDTIQSELQFYDGLNWREMLTPENISDLDDDTKIVTEQNSDDDIIRFFSGGQERWRMDGSFLIPISGGSESDNTAMGYNSSDVDNGAGNSSFGSYSLQFNASGNYNTAIGSNALFNNSSGSNNVAIGNSALYGTSTGINNTAIGNLAGESVIGSGSNNIYIGYNSGSGNGTNNRLFIGEGDIFNALVYGELDNGLVRINNVVESEEVRIAESTNPILTFERTASGGYDAQIELSSSGDMYFKGGNQLGSLDTTMVLQGDGDLHVFHAGSNGKGIRFTNTSNGKYWTLHTDDGSSGQLRLYSTDGGGAYVGVFNSTTGTYTAVSDRRRKKNILALESVIDKVMALKVSRYQYNGNPDPLVENIGLIAQEVNEVFPEFVAYGEDEDLYTLDYAGLSSISIKAIQEQQITIEKQFEEITELKRLLKLLDKKVSSLAKKIDEETSSE